MEKITKKAIVNLFLYGGTDKQTYNSIEYRLLKKNHKFWMIASFLFSILMLGEFGASFFIESLAIHRYVYLSICLFYGIGAFLLHFILKKEKLPARIWIQLSMLVLFAFAINLANIGTKEEYAVTIMVAIIVLPISIDCKPYRTILLIIVAALGEIISTAVLKVDPAKSMDIYNCMIFSVISLVLNVALVCGRIRAESNESILRRMAYVDSLTGLGNEYSYLEKREMMERRIQSERQPEFAVAMFDLNNLKKTNDTYGHAYGCNLVITCGKYIRTLFETSQCYHIGGDEYLVIIEGKDLARIAVIFEQFDKDMASYYVTKNDLTIRMTCARGYAIFNGLEDHCFADVLQKADNLMYENKRSTKARMEAEKKAENN